LFSDIFSELKAFINVYMEIFPLDIAPYLIVSTVRKKIYEISEAISIFRIEKGVCTLYGHIDKASL
jgi:hypothetical protein